MKQKPTKNQFSKYAKEYGQYNIIQQIVSKALVRDISTKPKTILELGCGSGQIFNHIWWDFEKYIAIDSSQQMCNLHPKGKNLEVVCGDFDTQEFVDKILDKKYDMILSSSALQWSKDIDKLIKNLSKSTNNLDAVLFTANTFKTIYTITNKQSPILTIENIKTTFSKYFKCEFELFNYDLEFNNKKKMFNYIKNSGVSGKSQLDFKDAKYLYQNYNLGYLEFEVIFVKARKF